VKLEIQPVPKNTALGDRWFLVATHGDRRWYYPLQLSELETRLFLRELQGLDWSLNESGSPVQIEAIHRTVERLVDGVGGGL
jgi:hypothetical protein